MSYYPIVDCLNPDEWKDLGYGSAEDILWDIRDRDHARWGEDSLRELGFTHVALETDTDYRFDKTILPFLYRLRDLNLGLARWTSITFRGDTKNVIHAWFSRPSDAAMVKLIWIGIREQV